jgi:hypothetical protein
MSPEEAFGVFLILVGCAAPIIIVGVVYYLKKRLEHKQIMTAIDKGIPISELRPPKPPKQNGALWIKNITLGIALLIIGIGWWMAGPSHGGVYSFIAFVLFGVGVAWIVRGVLNRKYKPQSQPVEGDLAGQDKGPAIVSAPES